MSRYNKYDIIKSLQLGYYDKYYFAEIGLNNRLLIIGHDDKLTLIKIGSKINIKKIYFLNNEFIKSIYTLDSFQILVGTNKGNLHLISLKNFHLNFDGVINICKENIEMISQEKNNFLVCIKCGKYFKLIDLSGKYNEKDFENDYFILLLAVLLSGIIIKFSKDKIKYCFKCLSNNNEQEN